MTVQAVDGLVRALQGTKLVVCLVSMIGHENYVRALAGQLPGTRVQVTSVLRSLRTRAKPDGMLVYASDCRDQHNVEIAAVRGAVGAGVPVYICVDSPLRFAKRELSRFLMLPGIELIALPTRTLLDACEAMGFQGSRLVVQANPEWRAITSSGPSRSDSRIAVLIGRRITVGRARTLVRWVRRVALEGGFGSVQVFLAVHPANDIEPYLVCGADDTALGMESVIGSVRLAIAWETTAAIPVALSGHRVLVRYSRHTDPEHWGSVGDSFVWLNASTLCKAMDDLSSMSGGGVGG